MRGEKQEDNKAVEIIHRADHPVESPPARWRFQPRRHIHISEKITNSRRQAQGWIDELPPGGAAANQRGGSGPGIQLHSTFWRRGNTHRQGQNYLAQARSKTTAHLITNKTRRNEHGVHDRAGVGNTMRARRVHVCSGRSARVAAQQRAAVEEEEEGGGKRRRRRRKGDTDRAKQTQVLITAIPSSPTWSTPAR